MHGEQDNLHATMREASRSRPSSSASRSDDCRNRRKSKVYDVPERYAHLSEVAAPSPVQNESEASIYRHESLEERVEAERRRSHEHDRSSRYSFEDDGRSRHSTRSRGLSGSRGQDGNSERFTHTKEAAAAPPEAKVSESRFHDRHTLDEAFNPAQQALSRDQSTPIISTERHPIRSKASSTRSSHEPAASREPDRRTHMPGSNRRKLVQISRQVSRLFTEISTVSYLVLFSILATLARLGLKALTVYAGAPVTFGILWDNFAGTLFLGYLTESPHVFNSQDAGPQQVGAEDDNSRDISSTTLEEGDYERPSSESKNSVVRPVVPLHIGLTTGFCGSFTSFSSFIVDTFLAASNDLPSLRNPTSAALSRRGVGRDIEAALAVIIVTLCCSLSALKLGAHIAVTIGRSNVQLPFRSRILMDRCAVFLAFGAWLGAIIMAALPPDRPSGPDSRGSWAHETWRSQALFAIVLAPLGCLLRFYASLKLNSVFSAFPLGTFTVNVVGTAILGMAWDLQRASLGRTADMVGGGQIGCQVLQGVIDGFCGCFTTVSTWATELHSLRRIHAYLYGVASVVTAFVILITIMGSVEWTGGWHEVVCAI